MFHRNDFRKMVFWGLVILSLLVGCQPGSGESPRTVTQVRPSARAQENTATPVPPQPSQTPVELAALVNGEGITQAEYQAEMARYRAAVGTEMATEDETFVIQDMVDQLLLAQAAQANGFVVDETTLQNRIDQLDIGQSALQTWLSEHGYTDESFREALARSIAAAWMRDQIIAGVPKTAEQVHARQILLYNSEEADGVYAQLEEGADFETLAEAYDPLLGGDLGWFPRGYLTVPELDEVIFDLAPGEYSPVIQTFLGYHIVQVIEKDSAHPLNPNTYRTVQSQALETWLQDHRTQSEITIYSP